MGSDPYLLFSKRKARKHMTFVRDHSLSLGDQAKNPGALNHGPRAERFGAKEEDAYEGTPGNKTAVFPTVSHGMAALMDLILSRKGLSINGYMFGNNEQPEENSYSGGAYSREAIQGYIDVFGEFGMALGTVISGSPDQLRQMVAAHTKAEGNQIQPTLVQQAAAFIILQGASKYIEGTDLEDSVIA